MIKPTIGRVVWVHRPETLDPGQPEAALVTYVWGNTCVNVGGFDKAGNPFSITSLYLDQGEGPRPDWVTAYAEWMPYQKGQAAKNEALETAAAARAAGPEVSY